MMKTFATIILIGLIFASAGALPQSEPGIQSFNQDWMDPHPVNVQLKSTFYYESDGENTGPAYNTSVIHSNETSVVFQSWWNVDGQNEGFDISVYDRATRESTTEGGRYAIYFINDSDLNNGYTILGSTNYTYSGQTQNGYVFSNSTWSFMFDKDGGWLSGFINHNNDRLLINNHNWSGDYPSNDLDPWGLSERYEFFILQDLNSTSLKAELDAHGRTMIDAFGVKYFLLLSPAPWDPITFIGVDDNGTETPLERDFEAVTYVGSIYGITDSYAYLILSEIGVEGAIQTPSKTINIQPIVLDTSTAPNGLSVLYHSHHIKRPYESVPFSTLDGEMDGSQDKNYEGGNTSQSPGPDRDILLYADSKLLDSLSKLENAYHNLNAKYSANIGFEFKAFENGIFYCESTSCDTDMGFNHNTCGGLLNNWPSKIKDHPRFKGKFDIASLFSGYMLNDIGCAYQSGRYGVSDGEQPQSDLNIILAHEVGHNFNGDHKKRGGTERIDCPGSGGSGEGTEGRARCWWHWHEDPVMECVLPPHFVYHILGICLEEKWHDEGNYHKHYTLMWGALEGAGENTYKFSDVNNSPTGQNKNYEFMRNCNNFSFPSKTNENSYALMSDPSGFGTHCTT